MKHKPDEHDQFGLAMASKLRKLATTNSKAASTLQLKLHELVHEYEQLYLP